MLFYQVLNRELIFLFANSAIIVAITVSPFDPLQPRKKTLARNTFVFIVFLPNRLVDPSITIHPLSYFHFAYDFPAQYLILNNNQKLINETIGRLFKINASTLSFTHRTELEQALWLLTFSVAMHDSNLRPSVDSFVHSFIYTATFYHHGRRKSYFGRYISICQRITSAVRNPIEGFGCHRAKPRQSNVLFEIRRSICCVCAT